MSYRIMPSNMSYCILRDVSGDPDIAGKSFVIDPTVIFLGGLSMEVGTGGSEYLLYYLEKQYSTIDKIMEGQPQEDGMSDEEYLDCMKGQIAVGAVIQELRRAMGKGRE